MYSLWNYVLPWVFFCFFSTETNQGKQITMEENNAIGYEGSCVTINCRYIYKDNIDLLWIKDPKYNDKEKKFDGIIVYSNTDLRPQASQYAARVEFQNEKYIYNNRYCKLKINNLQKNDGGNYSFRYIGEDTDKYISDAFNLTVIDNPCKVHIKPLNLNKTFTEGETVSFHCGTSAACQHNPEWKLSNSIEVLSTEKGEDQEEKHSVLNLTMSWSHDGRSLTCHFSKKSDDCLERTVTLTVKYPPRETTMNESASSIDVKEGKQVIISCSSKAQPKASYNWFHYGSANPMPGQFLTFNEITKDKSGVFYCEAKNDHGTDKSRNITINVTYAPKGVKISSQSPKLNEGEQLTLTCSVEASNPKINNNLFKWYKDQERLNCDDDTYILERVERSDSGSYQCEAENSVGASKSTNMIIVTVQYAPQNTFIKGWNEVKLGSSLNLECSTEADPVPSSYCWYFKPEHQQDFVTISHIAHVYQIENAALSDAGLYKCNAKNDIGSGNNSTQREVLVLYPPTKPSLTMKVVVKENDSLSITCTVQSVPSAMLTLSRSSLSLKKTQDNSLNFTMKAKVSDAGVYICTAENSEGVSSSEKHLEVQYAPKNVMVSAHPSNVLVEGSRLTLTCTADSVPNVLQYTWEKTSGPHSVGNKKIKIIHSLNRSDSGAYFCISRNDLGSTRSLPTNIRVKYKPHITITHNMTSLNLWEYDLPVHLTCNAQCDPPATSYEWYKKDKNVMVSNSQNYVVQTKDPGMYYCTVRNEVGQSSSTLINVNHFFFKPLIQAIISLLVILFLVGVIFLLLRIIQRKRSGNNESLLSCIFSSTPFSPSNSRNNTRENLVIQESTESFDFRDNRPAPFQFHSNPPAGRTRQAGRPNTNIHTVYDAVKLPPQVPIKPQSEEDLNMTTVNYAMLQFKDNNNQKKSVPSDDDCGAVYAKVSKKQNMKKEQKGGQDYENISGACVPKWQFPNMMWDSDTSESEEEVSYSKVSFTVTSPHEPPKDINSSDDEDKTEYSEVKV